MLDNETLQIMSLNTIESIEAHIVNSFTDQNDLLAYDQSAPYFEVCLCLIPLVNFEQSHLVFNNFVTGENGYHIFGHDKVDRLMMLIKMMKIYEKKHKIHNLILHNFIHKAIAYFREFQEPFTWKTIKRPLPHEISFQRASTKQKNKLQVGKITYELF